MHITAYFPFHFLFHHDFWDIYFIREQTGEWMTSSDYTFIWLLVVMSTKKSWKPRNVFTRNYTFLDAIRLCTTAFYFISNQIKTFQVQQDREQRHDQGVFVLPWPACHPWFLWRTWSLCRPTSGRGPAFLLPWSRWTERQEGFERVRCCQLLVCLPSIFAIKPQTETKGLKVWSVLHLEKNTF